MIRPLDDFLKRLDVAYQDDSHFVRLKARLLLGLNVLLLALVVMNLTRFLWTDPPSLNVRILFNLSTASFTLVSSFLLLRGKSELAGSCLALGLVLSTHALIIFNPAAAYYQPLATAFQLFAFDCLLMLIALIFAGKRTAVFTFIIIVAGSSALYFKALNAEEIPGTLRYAADTLARDGLLSISFIFALGVLITVVLEYVSKQNEHMLQSVKTMNANLEARVVERTQELECATKEAMMATQAKSDFLANMSHEIRTPLYGIIAQTEMMRNRQDHFADKDFEDLNIIAESGNLLLRLINDILDFSKIEAAQLKLEANAFDLSQLVHECIAVIATNAKNKQVAISYHDTEAFDRTILGDSHRLKQVLLNLLSNAVKFTHVNGKVTISIQRQSLVNGMAEIQFKVSDTGIGMDTETQQRIFDRFTQADSSTTRHYGGTGLGLAISSRLVAMMGGELSTQSELGVGSTFAFTLTLPVGEKVDQNPDKALLTRSPLGLHVLIAEDNQVNQKIITRQLESIGCTHVLAQNGAEALSILKENPGIDLILMDSNMPILDGQQATNRIRQWEMAPDASPTQLRAARLPIISFTASMVDLSNFAETYPGMTDFLIKPLKIQELYDVLCRYRSKA